MSYELFKMWSAREDEANKMLEVFRRKEMHFDWKLYRDFNPDLVAAGLKTQRDFEGHWARHGHNEGRKYSAIQLTEPHFIIGVVLMGGLGNRMFQIASAWGVARHQHKKVYVIKIKYNPHSKQDYMRTIFRNVAVRIDYGSCINRIHSEVGEDALRYREIPRLLDNVTMYGYFQSPTYFDHCREEIQNLFAPEEWRVKYLAVKYESAQNAYFIHVRRGDYLTHEMHNVDLRGYYKRALDMVGRDKLYYVFSDDLNWCQNWEELRGMNVRYINEPDELNSLYLMSMCGLGGICANSSYSWWGAYLNRNSDKKIILPQKWFNNDWVIENACSDWTVLE